MSDSYSAIQMVHLLYSNSKKLLIELIIFIRLNSPCNHKKPLGFLSSSSFLIFSSFYEFMIAVIPPEGATYLLELELINTQYCNIQYSSTAVTFLINHIVDLLIFNTEIRQYWVLKNVSMCGS